MAEPALKSAMSTNSKALSTLLLCCEEHASASFMNCEAGECSKKVIKECLRVHRATCMVEGKPCGVHTIL